MDGAFGAGFAGLAGAFLKAASAALKGSVGLRVLVGSFCII
jgi:hypothetical protein